MKNYETNIVIIGAGASGMMSAYFASAKGKKVIVIDHNKQVGRKILISGGGRCNFTNMFVEASDYACENPHFVKSALSRFSPWDFVAMIEAGGVPYFEKKLGQLFCKDSAKDINNMLMKQLQRPNIEFLLEQKDIELIKTDSGFLIKNNNLEINCENVIIATGGLVLPSIGASDFGYKVAKHFGHKIIPTTPALVPFKVSGFSSVKGNAFVVGASCKGHYIEEEVLFTHKGLSGPGILKISLFWDHGDTVVFNWLPTKNVSDLIESAPGNIQIDTVLKRHLPNSFVDLIFNRIGLDGSKYVGGVGKADQLKIIEAINAMKITPEGSEGFRKAEATRGGVDTAKVSSKTMESQLQPGLFFVGEVLDVTGQLGGFNFQWAWASAHAAGTTLA
jgi:predicted Rossmann fold flavoprotein